MAAILSRGRWVNIIFAVCVSGMQTFMSQRRLIDTEVSLNNDSDKKVIENVRWQFAFFYPSNPNPSNPQAGGIVDSCVRLSEFCLRNNWKNNFPVFLQSG